MRLILLIVTFTGLVYGHENSCESRCNATFPLHTFPKKESYFACLRGCRLQRIDQVARISGKSLHNPERTCERDCKTAYQKDEASSNACSIGCQSAQSMMQTRTAMLKNEERKVGFHNNFIILHPVFVIRRYCTGLYNVAISYIGKQGWVESDAKYAESMTIEVVDGSTILHIESMSEVSLRGQNGKKVAIMQAEERNSKEASWLDCVSHKAGLPKWILGAALLIAISSVIYLCFSYCCEEEHENLHKFEDVYPIADENNYKTPLLLEIEQAPPLPPKYSEKDGVL